MSLSAQTCDPPTSVSVSSITSTTATVNWTPYGGASFTWLHYKEQGFGSESTVSVAGSSYQLTGLLPCHTYEVRLRSACGSIFTSDYTSTETFSTASSEPTVEVNYTLVLNDCQVLLSATDDFLTYRWTHVPSSDIDETSDTNNVITDRPGVYYLEAVDVNGCIATATCTVPNFDSRCVSRQRELDLIDSLNANLTSLKANVVLLAKGLATVYHHSDVKQVIKNIALAQSNPKPYYAPLNLIQDSCTGRSINLKSLIKSNLWGMGFSASDTARIVHLLDSIKVAGSPNTYVYPEVYYTMLNPEIMVNAPSGWDTLTPEYVSASALHNTGSYKVYNIISSQVTETVFTGETWASTTPVWQVMLYSKIPNAFDWRDDMSAAPVAICRCLDGPMGGSQDYDCLVSGNKNKCGTYYAGGCGSGNCNSIIAKIIRIFCCH